MTINAPASLLLLLYELVAERQGVPGERAARHRAERHPQGVRRPAGTTSSRRGPRCASRPTSSPTAASGCRAGTRSRSPATTSARRARRRCRSSRSRWRTASRTARRRSRPGLSPDEFGERLSFFFNAHNHFFQEVAKFRAARRMWARIMRERFGATNPRALALRFHAQTGGSTLTAQQPENNVVRVAVQALSAVCGGAQSLHTNGFDEALALPTERSARIALRTQQILAARGGRTTDTADPLGGSYFIEALTRELEERACELIERVDELGGAVAADRAGLRAARDRGRGLRATRGEVEAGERVIVGVNRFRSRARRRRCELHRLDPEAERRQIERTRRVRAERDAAAAEARCARVQETARGDANLLRPCAPPWRAVHGRRDLRRAARGLRHLRRARGALARRGRPRTPALGGDPVPDPPPRLHGRP